MILDQDGDVAGYLGKSFVDLIDALKEDEEIPGRPAVIKGISLKVVDGKIDILGMGHLKFQEY